jgi:hypothetical protein
MDTNEQQAPSADSHCESQRAVIRLALDEIAAEVGAALRAANLSDEVFLTVPMTGAAVATVATALNPSTDDWLNATAIACRIIGKRLGDVRLRGRPLRCAAAHSQMGAAEVTPNATTEQ